jgi:hypothetical protein
VTDRLEIEENAPRATLGAVMFADPSGWPTVSFVIVADMVTPDEAAGTHGGWTSMANCLFVVAARASEPKIAPNRVAVTSTAESRGLRRGEAIVGRSYLGLGGMGEKT